MLLTSKFLVSLFEVLNPRTSTFLSAFHCASKPAKKDQKDRLKNNVIMCNDVSAMPIRRTDYLNMTSRNLRILEALLYCVVPP